MKRKVFLNSSPNVTMYSSEAGTNMNNCATGCSGCNSGGGGDNGAIIAIVSAGVGAGATILAAGIFESNDTE